jgi:hypothetical protein
MSRYGASRRPSRGRVKAAVAVTSVLLVTGCAPSVAMDAAPNATDPGCAEVIVRLPDTLEGLTVRETNAQATAAWGSPATVLLTCGLPAQPPTSLLCLPIGTVEWLIDDSDPQFTTATSHGRRPVTRVVIDKTETGGQTILAELEPAVTATQPDPDVAPCK